MQIRDIAWSSLKRRKTRFAFVLAALAIGVGTIVWSRSRARCRRK